MRDILGNLIKKYSVHIEACGDGMHYEGVHHGADEQEVKDKAVRKAYGTRKASFHPDHGLGPDFGQPVAHSGTTLDGRIHIWCEEIVK